MQNLRLVFQRIKEAGLKVSPDKCHLFQLKVKFLGHYVSENGIETDQDKISAISN